MALCRIVEALFAFRTRGIQEQVLVSQHSQYGFLWTLRYLRMLKFLSKLQKSFKDQFNHCFFSPKIIVKSCNKV